VDGPSPLSGPEGTRESGALHRRRGRPVQGSPADLPQANKYSVLVGSALRQPLQDLAMAVPEQQAARIAGIRLAALIRSTIRMTGRPAKTLGMTFAMGTCMSPNSAGSSWASSGP
jgi:hypothetical protein